jgi:hypothetical protein
MEESSMSEETRQLADRFEEDFGSNLDPETREAISSNYDRRKLGRIAALIAEDRFNAGSTAARVALLAYLLQGEEAALNFVRDLEFHEG